MARSDEETKAFMKEHHIRATGDNVPKPVLTFEESGLPKYLLDILKMNPKYEKPTGIQS